MSDQGSESDNDQCMGDECPIEQVDNEEENSDDDEESADRTVTSDAACGTLPWNTGTRGAERVRVTGEARRTSRLMTRFERARVLGARAKEIENNAENVDPKIVARAAALGIDSALDIAEMELEDRSVDFPIVILRPYLNNRVEVWPVRDLILPSETVCLSFDDDATRLLIGTSVIENCTTSTMLSFQNYPIVKSE